MTSPLLGRCTRTCAPTERSSGRFCFPLTAPRKYVECIASLLEEHCRPPQPSGKQQDEKQEEMGGQQQLGDAVLRPLPRPERPPRPLVTGGVRMQPPGCAPLLADIVAAVHARLSSP